MVGRRLRIFVLGAYRSFGGSRADLELLQGLRDRLRLQGYHAFLAIDPEATEILEDSELPPLEMTKELADRSHVLFFVFTSTGRLEGVASELATLQVESPEGASRRVVFYEDGYPLSAILDPEQEGVLAIPPVVVVPFDDSEELYEAAVDYARLIERYGEVR